jgi:two-component system, NarL family, invasion response regulator UvrY
MIRIFVADDHLIIRQGIEKLIENESDMQVVGFASNSFQVLEFLEMNSCGVLMLDITMPGKTGLDVLEDIVQNHNKTKVLILSMHPSDRFALRCFKLGASGYLSKDADVNKIIEAIRTVYSGNKYITNELANNILFNLNQDKQPVEKLSNREFQVFLKLASGLSVTETAKELSLSQSTINTYRSRILEKMELKSNMELVYYAIKNHIIE